jgi:hypothetical protein
MLVELQVENFGSIRERQTMTLVASKAIKEHLETHTFSPTGEGMDKLTLLRSSAVYGANAAGKSNLVRALWRMGQFVLSSDREDLEGKPVPGLLPPPFVPFKLSPEWVSKPSRFEVTFLQDKIRYQYGFALSGRGVEEEWLVAYPKGRPQTLFERGPRVDTGWYLNRSLGGKTRDLQDRTRPDALFLSVAARWNHAVLSPVHGWFKNHLRWIDSGVSWDSTVQRAAADPAFKENLVAFLRRADFGVTDVQFKTQPGKSFIGAFAKGALEPVDPEQLFPYLMHQRSDGTGTVLFVIQEESAGTLKYLTLAGPWLDVLANGNTLLIDELESSLHPLLVRKLIEIFHSPKHNPNNAQLIFTTHQSLLLDQDLLRRDQVWFVEKNSEGATEVFPLTDFSPRNREALQKGYLSGRYGAIPLVEEGLL